MATSKDLIDSIKIIAQSSIKNAPYDKTYEGTILSVSSTGYSLKLNGVTYENIKTTGRTCTVGEIVKIKVPQNNFNLMYIEKFSGSGEGSVTSVNGKTGNVTLTASDVEALPNTTIVPTKTSQLTNDSGFLSSIPSEYVTETEMQMYAQPKGDYATKTDLNTKLSLSGGTMTGDIDMGSAYINNLAPATVDNQAVTYKQLKDAIDGIGTVFDLKGTKLTVADLPTTGNQIGDVWYVESESVGYIWLQDTSGTLRWEKFGEQIDLSGYLTKAGLLQSTGQITDNTMSQKAITDILDSKVDDEVGKGLSTNDFTDALESKLNGIQAGAEVNVNADWNAISGDAEILNKPTSLPASDVYPWAKQPNKPTYTASEVGLGNVPNVTTNDQTPTYTDTTTFATLTSGEKLSVAFAKIKLAITNLINHIANVSNPHNVTKTQVGLGNVDNTSDANKPISTATQTALKSKAPINNPTFTGTVSGITKSMIGLGNVDNTADNVKNVASAVKATQDASGNVITTTYATKSQIPTSLPPNGTAGGDLTGTYPNPTIGSGKVTKAKLETSVQTSLGKADTALQSIPIGGASIGGVKNGGNVTISSDGTMNASGTNIQVSSTQPTNQKTDDLWYKILD